MNNNYACTMTKPIHSGIVVSIKMLPDKQRAQVIHCICEGNSIRSTVRLTGISKNTITKLLVELGDACIDYQDRTLRNLNCKRIQCDETWSFVCAKQKSVPAEKKSELRYGGELRR